jgi:hypothetical protein
VTELDKGLDNTLFQTIALNNNGDVLCSAEERSPFQAPNRNGQGTITRYRTTRVRYFLYHGGTRQVIKDSADLYAFRPIALNDKRQVLGLLSSPRRLTLSAPPPGMQPGPSFAANPPSPGRSSRIVLWENGTLRDLNLGEHLLKAGMSPRFLSFVETANINMNSRGQVLIGLQNLYLWENGKVQRIGNSSIGIGERIFLNDNTTIIRRADQYRAAPDGQNFYPLMALFRTPTSAAQLLDFGYGTFVFDLNGRDEMLLGKLFATNPDEPRVRFTISDGQNDRTLFTVSGRAPARFNNQGHAVAWRSPQSGGEWRLFFMQNALRSSVNIPVFWNGKKLYDLTTLVPPEWTITNVIDFNDKDEFIVQVRHQGKLKMVLLTPEAPV